MLRNLALERAALGLELRRHAAASVLLGDRCNRLAELTRSEAERQKLTSCASALANTALAVFADADGAAPEKGIAL